LSTALERSMFPQYAFWLGKKIPTVTLLEGEANLKLIRKTSMHQSQVGLFSTLLGVNGILPGEWWFTDSFSSRE
jgi:hypothetical protein